MNIKSLILVLAPVFAFPVTGLSEGEESHVGEYTGVVTMQPGATFTFELGAPGDNDGCR